VAPGDAPGPNPTGRTPSGPVVGIVQARTGSTRLPGKVLKTVCGQTLLEHQMERMLRARSLDRLVVATTTSPADDAVVDLVRARGWVSNRGSESDVLSRYAEAARAEDAAVVVRMTMDCPLVDPEVVDLVVATLRGGPFDFAANNLEPTFPHGLDLEAFTRPTLDAADREAVAAFDREHVSPFVRDRPDRFRLGNVRSPVDLHHHRWTVDYPEDLEFVRAVYEALYRPGGFFSTRDVLALLGERPELSRINAGRAT
jgi:spore coat polysaccharide biosynthesis protein SpsF